MLKLKLIEGKLFINYVRQNKLKH